MKTTPWFPGDVKPVRAGVYERPHPDSQVPVFSYWNGSFWCAYSPSIEHAVRCGLNCIGSLSQDLEWRGLAEPTEKK